MFPEFLKRLNVILWWQQLETQAWICAQYRVSTLFTNLCHCRAQGIRSAYSCIVVWLWEHFPSHLVLQQSSSKLLFLCMRKGGKAKLKAMGSLSLSSSASHHPCELSVPRVPGKWARRQSLFTSPQMVLLPAVEVELLRRGLTLTVWGYLDQNGSR